ncbi:MAG: hypothetical protein ACWA42_05720 [Lutibacter sp.]
MVTILFVTASCDKNGELLVFDNVNGPTMVQFTKTSLKMSTPTTGLTATVDVLVTTVSDVDRSIDVEIVPQTDPEKPDATPDQYTIGNLMIPAGSYSGTVTITSNYDALPAKGTGSTFLTLKLTGLNNTNTDVDKGILNIELFKKCEIVPGDYSFHLIDVYGDGWQGSHITVTIDGVSQDVALTSYWDTDRSYYGPEFYDFTYTVNVPAGTKELLFSFTRGDYPEETYYEIYSPNGNLIASDGNPNDYDTPPVEGPIEYNACNL